MIVEQVTYNRAEETYDSSIFTSEKNTDFSKACRAKKNVQEFLQMKCVSMLSCQKDSLFQPLSADNYSPDWAIAFNKGVVKQHPLYC